MDAQTEMTEMLELPVKDFKAAMLQQAITNNLEKNEKIESFREKVSAKK